jgi:hypothetical protein
MRICHLSIVHVMYCVKQVLMWARPNFYEQGGTNQKVAIVVLSSNEPRRYHRMVVAAVTLSNNELL